MIDFGVYTIYRLSGEEKAALSKTVTEHNQVLRRVCAEKYGDFGSKNLRKLRDDYKQYARKRMRHESAYNPLWFDPRAEQCMIDMHALESKVLGTYIRVAKNRIHQFLLGKQRFPGVTDCDCVQEAALAIYDAQYTYDGSMQFTTYSYWCADRRIIDFLRKELRRNELSRNISHLAQIAADIMGRLHVSCEQAIGHIPAEEGISESMVGFVARSAKRWSETNPGASTSEIARWIEEADLTPIQRELIDAQMEGCLAAVVRRLRGTMVNPRTGRAFSRQAIYNQYTAALAKLRSVSGEQQEVA